MNGLRFYALLTAGLLLAGCDKAVPPAVSAPAPVIETGPRQAQPRLPTIKLFFGTSTNIAVTEIARTEIQVQTGMMFRTNMPEMEAMIFIFPDADYRSFWMKNTLVPLSCAYINPEGVIMELHDMKPKDTTSIPSANGQIQYVLEVNQGWFQRHNVTPGMVIQTEKGSLRESFFSGR